MTRYTRTGLAIAFTFLASLVLAAAAQAVVVSDPGAQAPLGVAMVPGTTPPYGPPTLPAGSSCEDPWLSSDFGGPSLPPSPPNAPGLCYQGGSVIHANEVFDLTWDGGSGRLSWASTKDYLEQFLRDVADGSGTLTSPYAVTTQYRDSGGNAANASVYGGGCSDYGASGGACQYGSTSPGPGHSYPSGSCPLTGSNAYCLTDADIRGEVNTMASQMGVTHAEPGYTPLLVVLLPDSVQVCLDSGGNLCSANSGSSSPEFCSYHGQVNGITYVVQPWVSHTNCDEPGLPALPPTPTPAQLATDAGVRLVNPLSQGTIAAITDPDPGFGWVATNGDEITDNDGCMPEGDPADYSIVGSSSQNPYYLRPEFNNAGVIDADPNTYFGCAHDVLLSPEFVLPSAINAGDVVAFDGSKTVTTLLVPNANYHWSFGDGTGAVGPSVEHTYAKAGQYPVTLTVTDRGGNVQSLTQTLDVLGPNGQPSNGGLQVEIQLMPQSLRSVLRSGLEVEVRSNEAADGIATISIPRSAARRAHIKVGRGASVVVGRGTVTGIKDGVAMLDLHLSRRLAKKLKHLRHVTFTVRISLVTTHGNHLAIDAAGRY